MKRFPNSLLAGVLSGERVDPDAEHRILGVDRSEPLGRLARGEAGERLAQDRHALVVDGGDARDGGIGIGMRLEPDHAGSAKRLEQIRRVHGFEHGSA